MSETATSPATYTAADLYNCQTDHAEPDWSAFDALELGGCINLHEPDDPAGTMIEGGQSRVEAAFFTVYGHLPEGGVEAITDIDAFDKAVAILQYLAARSLLPPGIHC